MSTHQQGQLQHHKDQQHDGSCGMVWIDSGWWDSATVCDPGMNITFFVFFRELTSCLLKLHLLIVTWSNPSNALLNAGADTISRAIFLCKPTHACVFTPCFYPDRYSHHWHSRIECSHPSFIWIQVCEFLHMFIHIRCSLIAFSRHFQSIGCARIVNMWVI